MTPEEIAKEITDQLWLDWPDVLDKDGTAIRIAAAIRDAYERAAEVAEIEENGGAWRLGVTPTAIRALKGPS